MKTCIVSLESVSKYGQSKHVESIKMEKESSEDFEERTWRERAHVDKNGLMFIPPMALKNCLADAAQYLSEKIKGKKNQTWTKHFRSGVIVVDPVPLNVHINDVEKLTLFVPSDGKPGGSTRVNRHFPVIAEWKADVVFYILDDTITEDVFQHHIDQAGKFIGIGFFRPARRGYFGRFKISEGSEIVFEQSGRS